MPMSKRKFGLSPLANYLFQFIFIFHSVFFAFWPKEQNEVRKLIKLEEQSVEDVYRELSANLKSLQSSISYRKEQITKLEAYEDSP